MAHRIVKTGLPTVTSARFLGKEPYTGEIKADILDLMDGFHAEVPPQELVRNNNLGSAGTLEELVDGTSIMGKTYL